MPSLLTNWLLVCAVVGLAGCGSKPPTFPKLVEATTVRQTGSSETRSSRRFDYEGSQLVQVVTDIDTYEAQYANGNLAVILGDRKSMTLTYDDERLVEIVRSQGTSTEEAELVYESGRLQAIIWDDGTEGRVSYSYEAGKPSAYTVTRGSGEWTFQLSYSGNDLVRVERDLAGNTSSVAFAYKNGRLSSVTADSKTTRIYYTDAGRIAEIEEVRSEADASITRYTYARGAVSSFVPTPRLENGDLFALNGRPLERFAVLTPSFLFE